MQILNIEAKSNIDRNSLLLWYIVGTELLNQLRGSDEKMSFS